jgi:hypothetical protein
VGTGCVSCPSFCVINIWFGSSAWVYVFDFLDLVPAILKIYDRIVIRNNLNTSWVSTGCVIHLPYCLHTISHKQSMWTNSRSSRLGRGCLLVSSTHTCTQFKVFIQQWKVHFFSLVGPHPPGAKPHWLNALGLKWRTWLDEVPTFRSLRTKAISMRNTKWNQLPMHGNISMEYHTLGDYWLWGLQM